MKKFKFINTHNSGFSLIELLISITVLSFVFLGISSSFLMLIQNNNSVLNKTTYNSIYHSYFKKIRYGIEGTLLENIDPETSYHLKFTANNKLEAYQIYNKNWLSVNPDMDISFTSNLKSRLKTNNWTFFKTLKTSSVNKNMSKNREIIFSRCITQENFLKELNESTLKEIYETKVYPVNILGDIHCCEFLKLNNNKVDSTCNKLDQDLLPTIYSIIVEKDITGYSLIKSTKLINVADMDTIYALSFNANFLIDPSSMTPTSAEIDFFSYKNLCKTSSSPSKSCSKIKKFSNENLSSNLNKQEFYSNIRLKSIKWPLNIYSTLLDSGNVVVY